MKKKLNEISSGKTSDWIERAEESLEHGGAQRNAWKLALRVLDILEEREMTQTELAQKMGVSRQQVTRILKGKENFTFKTVDKLEQALGEILMTIGEIAPATVAENPACQPGSKFAIITEGDVDRIYWSSFVNQQIRWDLIRGTKSKAGDILLAPHHGTFIASLLQNQNNFYPVGWDFDPNALQQKIDADQMCKEECFSKTA